MLILPSLYCGCLPLCSKVFPAPVFCSACAHAFQYDNDFFKPCSTELSNSISNTITITVNNNICNSSVICHLQLFVNRFPNIREANVTNILGAYKNVSERKKSNEATLDRTAVTC